jgi:hypothetical protein
MRALLQHGNGNVHDGKLAIEVHPVNFPTPFVPSSTSIGATLHPESEGGTLSDEDESFPLLERILLCAGTRYQFRVQSSALSRPTSP